MAVCLECKADYLSGITVCPACGRALEPEPPTQPPADGGFVPFFSGGYLEGLAAAASLEAAGLETQLITSEVNAYMATPMFVTVLVRARDYDAACAALRLSPESALRAELGMSPKVQAPACAVCGSPATVHESERSGRSVDTLDYCSVHAAARIAPVMSDENVHLDEDVMAAVESINRKPGVRTLCSCSGSHSGAGQGFIALGPKGTDTESVRLFDTFLTALFMRLKEPELRGRLSLHWTPMHGAELKLIDPTYAKVTWSDLARLVEST
jgi:hypothetical protein